MVITILQRSQLLNDFDARMRHISKCCFCEYRDTIDTFIAGIAITSSLFLRYALWQQCF